MPDPYSYAIIGAIVVGVVDFVVWYVWFRKFRESPDKQQRLVGHMMLWGLVPIGMVSGGALGYVLGIR